MRNFILIILLLVVASSSYADLYVAYHSQATSFEFEQCVGNMRSTMALEGLKHISINGGTAGAYIESNADSYFTTASCLDKYMAVVVRGEATDKVETLLSNISKEFGVPLKEDKVHLSLKKLPSDITFLFRTQQIYISQEDCAKNAMASLASDRLLKTTGELATDFKKDLKELKIFARNQDVELVVDCSVKEFVSVIGIALKEINLMNIGNWILSDIIPFSQSSSPSYAKNSDSSSSRCRNLVTNPLMYSIHCGGAYNEVGSELHAELMVEGKKQQQKLNEASDYFVRRQFQ